MTKTLSQKTAERLKEKIIVLQEYKAGDKLPNENELAQLMDVSRSTIREAIRLLVFEGILEVQRGNGTFVTSLLNQSANPVEFSETDQQKVTLRDLYEARLIFEPEAAALAAKRATDEEIENILALGQAVQELILSDPQGKERIASESAFHGALVRASHNDFLSQFLPIITETIEKTFALRINLDIIAEDAYKDHILIMNFLEKRDADALRSAVKIHLHHAVWNEKIDLDRE